MKRWLTLLMAMLVALQSMQVIADAHTSLESSTQHLVFSGVDTHASTGVSDESTGQPPAKVSQSVFDCHGHCHGHVYLYLNTYQHLCITILPVREMVKYTSSFQSLIPASLLRPPIA